MRTAPPNPLLPADTVRARTAKTVRRAPPSIPESHRVPPDGREEKRDFLRFVRSQVILGHARADVTEVYAERDLELAMAVMDKIG